LPRDIVEKINQTTMKVLRTDAMKDKLERLGVDPMFMSSAEFTAFVDKDIVSGGALARAVGLKAN
jgi:tripartite-type tricarboxylate transporter receptor subunit TctC